MTAKGTTMPRNQKRKEPEFEGDPLLPVEDEEFTNEQFEMLLDRGRKPEDLPDQEDRDAYRAWLEKQGDLDKSTS
jgi:hypothetical protein